MATKNSITQIEKDGVEYFCLKSGETGMSISGLARSCGVTKQSMSERLGHRQDGWNLDIGRVWVTGKRGNSKVVVVRDIVCAETIQHYAMQGKPEALRFAMAFMAAGIRSHIQQLVGWVAPSVIEVFIEDHMLREARQWEVVFDRKWRFAAMATTGWKWGDPCMAQLINLTVYDQLPVEVREELDRLNPVLENGHRAKKQHQFFTKETVEKVILLQVEVARSLLLVSTSWAELKENSRRRFDQMYQLKLL